MTREYFTCREMTELVTEYLEGAMPAAERAVFEHHLALCDGCTGYLDQMRQTVRIVGRLADEDVPPPARPELLDLLRRLREGA